MNNCFVKSIKAVVNNDNLPKFNVLVINTTQKTITTNEQVWLKIGTLTQCTITALDGGYFSESYAGLNDPALRLTSKTITASDGIVSLWFLNDAYSIEVTNASSLNSLEFVYKPAKQTIFSLDLADVKDSIYLETLRIPTSGSTGDVSNLAALTELEYLDANACENIKGDVVKLHGLTKVKELIFEWSKLTGNAIDAINHLPIATRISFFKNTSVTGAIDNITQTAFTFLTLQDTAVNGTVEGLVASQVNNGRINASDIDIYGITKFATFGGNTYSAGGGKHMYVSWEGTSKIIISTGATLATVSNNTIYAKGASASEISTWEGRGNTVVVIS